MKKDAFKAYASILADKPTDEDVIAAWLAEKSLDETLCAEQDDEIDTVQDNLRLEQACGPYDIDISVSQIRILSKCYTNDPDVIPYVAVLEKWEDGVWLLAPFSQYSVPATPGEISTGLHSHALKVLQIWNCRTVQEPLLRKSFLLGTLPESIVRDALSLFRHEMGGVDLPVTFAARRGAPITLEEDPRRVYLAESVDRLEPLAVAVIKMAEGNVGKRRGHSLDTVFLRRVLDLELPDRLAAATDGDSSFMLIIEGDTAEDVRKRCVECRLLNDFISIYPGDEPYKLAFQLCQKPEGISDDSVVSIRARNRDTLEIVGEGILDMVRGAVIITTRSDIKDSIEKPEQIVIVMACERD